MLPYDSDAFVMNTLGHFSFSKYIEGLNVISGLKETNENDHHGYVPKMTMIVAVPRKESLQENIIKMWKKSNVL